jgi:tRNA 2-thiouridine synthesizing protein A
MIIASVTRRCFSHDESREMTEKTLNRHSFKCKLPALRTRKALGAMTRDDILIVECTDPLTAIDMPDLIN